MLSVLSFVRYVKHDDRSGLRIPLDEREHLFSVRAGFSRRADPSDNGL